jgi:hypothetical protein
LLHRGHRFVEVYRPRHGRPHSPTGDREEEIPMEARTEERRSGIRQGVVAGVLGATVVALWFLVIDATTGRPLHTPEVLGRGLLGIFGRERAGVVDAGGDGPLLVVSLYSVFHYLAFIVVGIVAAAIVRAGEREPNILAGALILFVAIEIGFYGLTALLAQTAALGSLAWYQIGLANLLAAAAMGTYLWRHNPALGRGLVYALQGRE